MTAGFSNRLAGIAGALALVFSVSCGDDPPKSGAKPAPGKAPRRAGAPAPAAGAAKAGAALETYNKIDEKYRRRFLERDFIPDSSAIENRDPFRSYVITIPGLSKREREARGVDATDLCTNKNSKATDYSIRSLTLIGIVLRGTRSYALFRDSAGLGHIVRRKDCLGQEKAVVEEIKAGIVRLEVIPAAPPGGKQPDPETRDFPLYPEQLELSDREKEDAE